LKRGSLVLRGLSLNTSGTPPQRPRLVRKEALRNAGVPASRIQRGMCRQERERTDAATDGQSRHSLLEFVCASRPTALAARVSMVCRTPCTPSGTTLRLYLAHIFQKGVLHEPYRLPGWRSRHHHRSLVILRPALTSWHWACHDPHGLAQFGHQFQQLGVADATELAPGDA